MMRMSPAAAKAVTVARKNIMKNGTPLRVPSGLEKAFHPKPISTSARGIATARAMASAASTCPGGERTDGGQCGDHKVGRGEPAKDVLVGQALAEVQDRDAESHGEHGVDEEQAAAAR